MCPSSLVAWTVRFFNETGPSGVGRSPSKGDRPDAHLSNLRSSRSFLVLLPKIETHGQIFFRHLQPHRKQEVLQEMRALAWRWFVRMAERGKDAADVINTFNTFLACAVKGGRRLTGREKAKDPMCEHTQRRHDFKVHSLQAVQRALCERLHSVAPEDADAFEERLRDNTQTPVPDQAAFRIDWSAWLRTRCERDRRIIAALVRGQQARDLSRKVGLSPARLSQLRREFQQDWERFVADNAEQDKAA